jgi:hypothetical protein
MPSQDDDRAGSTSDSSDQKPAKVRRRRLHGACDACRKKKGEFVSIIRSLLHEAKDIVSSVKCKTMFVMPVNATSLIYLGP